MKDKYLLYLSGVISEETFIKELKNIKESKEESKDEELNNYMFFENLHIIKRCIHDVLKMNHKEIDVLLEDHDWASDHVSGASTSIQRVCSLIKNLIKKEPIDMENM
jgi:uncharacterized protein YcbK (DUF882 family)